MNEQQKIRCKNCGVKDYPLIERAQYSNDFILKCRMCKCELTYNKKKGKWE